MTDTDITATDITALVERLRNTPRWRHREDKFGQAFADQVDNSELLDKAAAALEALQAENERLRAFIIEEGMRSTIQTLNAEERAEKAETALKEQQPS